LGCDSIAGAHLVVLTTAGEIAVYRAYEHCSQEYVAQRATARPVDGVVALKEDEALAVQFVRMQHDILAYDPDYEQKVQRVQAKQARAFRIWDKQNKRRIAEQLRAEKLTRARAQEKQQQHDEAMAIADWGDGSDDEPPGGPQSEADADAGAAADADAEDTGAQDAMDIDEEAASDDGDDDVSNGEGLYPLESTCKFTTLDNLGGYPALFVSGLRPVLVMVGPKRFARVHPLRLPGRLPPTLLPLAGVPKDFDAEAAGLATPGRPVVGMARFHSPSCAHGAVALTQAGTVVVAALQTSAQAARGGIEFDAPWPVRCIPVGTARSGVGTQGGIVFHAGSGCYAAATTTIAPFRIREPNPDVADQQAREAARAGLRAEPAPGRVIPEFQRAGLDTTSAPPLVPRFAVDLLSPVTWETIDSHQLEPDEHISAMRALQLDSAQVPGGSRTMLCVGTGFVLGEDVLSRGRIYVFDIVDVVPLPGRPQTSRRLKLRYQEDVHGAISALCELRGSLVMSVGSKIFVRSFNGTELVSFAFLDCQNWVRSLCGVRNFLVIGDLISSVWLAGFQEESPTQLQVLGRDPARLPVECVDAVVLGHQMQVLAADAHGHLHFLIYAPREAHSSGGQRLLRRGEYSLGSRAVAVRRLVAPSAGTPRQVCLVATASGAVHAVAMLPEKSFKRLHRVAAQLIRGIPPLAGLNPREYRAVPLHHRNHHAPRRTVLDGDLLAPLYAHGPASRQRDVAQRDGTSPDRVLRDIVDIESAFGLL
ncbi:mRNA cleavage and polyadenylation factor subunit, partial [Coemansia spiralis]